MNRTHREMIDKCCEEVVPRINLENLWPKLLENKVFNRDDVNVPKWTESLANRETIRDVYLTIKTRGPLAFDRFTASLRESGHENLADILERKNVFGDEKVVTLATDDNTKYNVTTERTQDSSRLEREQDTFFHSIQSSVKPLTIQLQKASKFLDEPTYVNVQRYPMRSKPRGLVLLITNIHYTYLGNPRIAAEHDEANLSELFTQMGFQIVPFRDLKGTELLEKTKEFSQRRELRKVDSCFVIISSHGDTNVTKETTEIKCVDYLEDNYKTVLCTDVMDCFTTEACPYLAGKPKIFIFQLCRGLKRQKAIKEPRHTTDLCTFSPSTAKEEQVTSYKTNDKKAMRNYADMFVAHATIPGHVCFRDNVTGSWFIQILCEVFMNHAWTTHLQDLFHIVDERLEMQRTTAEECQTLMVTSIGFNKHCYLNPGLFE